MSDHDFLGEDEILAERIFGEKKFAVLRTALDDTMYVEITNAEEEGELQKKLASLTLTKWKYFCDNLERLQQAVKNLVVRGRGGSFKLHLGSNQFVSISTGYACSDIRRWYVCPMQGKLLPSKNGIALHLDDFKELVAQVSELNEDIPNMHAVIPCQYTRADESSTLTCTFCTPSATF